MIIYCPRCRLPLEVDPPTQGSRHYTCPGCLELITVVRREPIPAIPLGYHVAGGDVEAEVQRDLKFSIWGIVAFGAMAVFGLVVAQAVTGGIGPSQAWLVWIAIVTGIVAMISRFNHARRRNRLRSGSEYVRIASNGRRVVRVVALGFSGLLLIVLTGVAALVLLFAACLFMAAGGGKMW